MKSTHSVTIILAIVVFLFNACSTKEKTSVSLPELMQAEAIMYEHPDSALHILQNMEVPSASQNLEHATWALLMTQAKYKMYIKQNDSLVNIAYDYFMKQEDAQRKALTLYLKGSMCYENKEIEEAQNFLLEATNYAENSEDYQLCHLVFGNLGNLYIFRSYKEYALNAFNKAYQYALKANNSEYIISALIYLGRTYSTLSDYKQSIEAYKKAIEIAKEKQNLKKYIYASNELAAVYTTIGNYEQALKTVKQAIENNKLGIINEEINLVIGKIYSNIGKSDSAYYYLNKAIVSRKDLQIIIDTNFTLYDLNKKEHKYKEALQNSDKLLACIDSIYGAHRRQDLIQMQEKYNQQKLINEKNQLKIEKDRNTRNALIVLIVLICTIAILIYNYQHKLVKKERIIQKKEEEIRRSMIQIGENETTIKHNLSRMQELTSQIKASQNMQEQLEELNRTYTEMQQQNEALANENQILQENITQYSSTLSAQSEELKKLNELTEENQRLHDRERTLSKQLVRNTKILNSLITTPKYIDTVQWKDIEEAINSIFDNFTERLQKKFPTLTEYEVHLCCLIKLNMNNTDMAIALGISPTSVSKQKYRLKERIAQQCKAFKQNLTLDLWVWDF